MSGSLYLVPNLLGIVPPHAVLPQRTLDIASHLRHFVVENAKPSRQFLKTLGTHSPLQAIDFVEIGDDPTPQRCNQLLAPARDGHDMGLLSDAGCPGVADPGALLVAVAHREQIVVVPLVGPSAVLLALMASGMNGQGFTFHGYLPIRTAARAEAIKRVENASRENGYAQLFIETPYRNAALLDALVKVCQPDTRLCLAVDLTTETESIVSRSMHDWRGTDFNPYDKRPAMFVLQSGR